MLSNREHQRALRQLEVLSEKALPPLARLEYGLHGIVTFGIMPLFALANAGVDLRGGGAALASTIGLGVILGLVVGKPIGITLASWVAVRAGVASLPAGIGWRTLAGTALLGGIGFTMSLFIASLAFGGSAEALTSAKLGTLVASLIAGVAGWMALRFTGSHATPTRRNETGANADPRTSAARFPSP